MALLTPIDPDVAAGDVRRMFDSLHRGIGRIPTMVRLMAHSPAVLDTYLHFNHALERTTLSATTRALITITVAELNGCDYTLSLGTSLAKQRGVGAEEIDLARAGTSRDAKTAQTLEFASNIVRSRGRVAVAEVERLREHGFTDAEIVDVVAAVVLNIFRNYFNLALGTDIDSPIVRSRHSTQLA